LETQGSRSSNQVGVSHRYLELRPAMISPSCCRPWDYPARRTWTWCSLNTMSIYVNMW